MSSPAKKWGSAGMTVNFTGSKYGKSSVALSTPDPTGQTDRDITASMANLMRLMDRFQWHPSGLAGHNLFSWNRTDAIGRMRRQ